MTTAFQATAFQDNAFQIDASGLSLALVATEGADLCAASVTLTALTANFSLVATEGTDACAASVAIAVQMGKVMSWVVLPGRLYTHKMPAKGKVRLSGRNFTARGDA